MGKLNMKLAIEIGSFEEAIEEIKYICLRMTEIFPYYTEEQLKQMEEVFVAFVSQHTQVKG